ncbi:hypothetical protein [Aeromicrobium wangtongii]|uniref:hypothetical protein n=1 Tax=Aeromicrobium wangtongii TaxID=2969247 RepID=UPI0020179E32|nr:hypothetical protein [Aeromicrobium wangtongii]MCL3820328.1 hypothetical protein [Aeromicrobium wangtongii]
MLTPVDRQPGFVCRVDGAPDSAGCVNTPPSDAYWGLFWSDGRSGTWTYASEGVGSLKVPAGGWVALVFQDSPDRSLPAVVPTGSTAPAPAGATSPRTVSGASGGPGQLGWVAAGLAVALLGGAAFLVRHRAAGGSS